MNARWLLDGRGDVALLNGPARSTRYSFAGGFSGNGNSSRVRTHRGPWPPGLPAHQPGLCTAPPTRTLPSQTAVTISSPRPPAPSPGPQATTLKLL
jgi:hypothetical protein